MRKKRQRLDGKKGVRKDTDKKKKKSYCGMSRERVELIHWFYGDARHLCDRRVLKHNTTRVSHHEHIPINLINQIHSNKFSF